MTRVEDSFLKHSAAASAGAAAGAWISGSHAAGSNERLTVGIIGCGGRGAGLAEEFAGLANVAYVCDPDESRRRRAHEKVHAQHAVADLRRILDDKSVDAVVIATPEHWHAPAAFWPATRANTSTSRSPPATTSAKGGCWGANAATANCTRRWQ